MRCGSVLVLLSKAVCINNLRGDFRAFATLPGELLYRDLKCRHRHPLSAEVGKDLDADLPLTQKLVDEGRGGFADRIDNVGSHRIADINKELNDRHVAAKLSIPD